MLNGLARRTPRRTSRRRRAGEREGVEEVQLLDEAGVRLEGLGLQLCLSSLCRKPKSLAI